MKTKEKMNMEKIIEEAKEIAKKHNFKDYTISITIWQDMDKEILIKSNQTNYQIIIKLQK